VISAEKLKTIEGAVTIWNTDTSNDIKDFQLNLPSLQSIAKDYAITGNFEDFSVTHGGLEVGKMMRIYSTDLKTLDFGGLQSVKGDFSVDSNTDLKKLTVGDFTTAYKAFSIQQNSALTSASFAKLKTIKGALTIYENSALTYFSLSALTDAETMSISSNGDDATIYFPLLENLGVSSNSSSIFSDAKTFVFSSLSNVTGAIEFSSTSSEDLVIPLVKTIGSGITVDDNSALTTFALPRVTSVGDLSITGNDKLTNVTANALKTAGSITIKGSLTNVEFFGLKEVTGDFKVEGDDSMDCYWFDENVKSIVQGKYTCVGDHDKKTRKSSTGGIENTEGNPKDYYISTGDDDGTDGSDGSDGSKGNKSDSDSDGSDNGSSGGSGSKGMSTGAKAGIAVGVIAGVALLFLAAFFFWRRRRNAATLTPLGARRGESRDSNESRKHPFDGQMLGVHTKIEASNPSPTTSAPSLGTLSFSRNSFLDASGLMADKTIKTIRRVSASSSGGSDTLRG
jgi:LPXTG-motif cell wall-anchored protein